MMEWLCKLKSNDRAGCYVTVSMWIAKSTRKKKTVVNCTVTPYVVTDKTFIFCWFNLIESNPEFATHFVLYCIL